MPELSGCSRSIAAPLSADVAPAHPLHPGRLTGLPLPPGVSPRLGRWETDPSRGVPNLFDPEVRAQYQPTVVGNLLSNPDFPMVMLVNTTGTHPGAVLVALDARNGSDTWSLSTDPIILIALFADPLTITDLYLDSGLLTQGTPSGRFQSVPNPREMLPDLLHALSEIPARTYL